MPIEIPARRRETTFPGREEHHGRHHQMVNDANYDSKRKTRFPGSLDHDFTLLTAKTLEDSPTERRTKDIAASVPSRIPLTVKGLDTTPTRPLRMSSKTKKPTAPIMRNENPWVTYKVLRNIVHGSNVQAACTRDTSIPTVMVAVKEASTTILIDEIIQFQHQNLVLFLESYRYENRIMVVSEYMQVSLRQTLAIPYDFDEIHISAVCTQVLDGMIYLSSHGYALNSLNSSKVLLSSNGCVKVAYIGNCRGTRFTNARPLGLLALEMMQKGVIQDSVEEGGKIVPRFPELWSAEATNFLELTSDCSLNEIKTNHFLNRLLSPTIMSPFVNYAQLEAIAPQIRIDLL